MNRGGRLGGRVNGARLLGAALVVFTSISCASADEESKDSPGSVARTTVPERVVVESTSYPTVPPPELAGSPYAGVEPSLALELSEPGPLGSEASLAVAVSRAAPVASLALEQCKAGASGTSDCISLGRGTADDSGDWSQAAVLRRYIQVLSGEIVDCAAAPGTCVVAAADLGSLTPENTYPIYGFEPLDFDPGQPAGPAPLVVLDRTTGLADGELVTVATSGFRAASVSFVVCQTGTGWCQATWPLGSVDSGTIAQLEMTRVVRSGLGSVVVDCADAPAVCELRVSGLVGDDLRARGVPLTFDAATPERPDPELDVEPSNGLEDGDVVRISISGFHSGEAFTRPLQCALVEEGDGCDTAVDPGVAVAEGYGTASFELTVRRYVTTSTGAADCTVRICVVWVSGGPSAPQGLLVPLSFTT